MHPNMNRRLGRPQSGGVLLTALAGIVLISALTAGMLQLGTALTRRQAHARDAKEAFYLAEAGLSEAYTALAQARTGALGSPTQPVAFGDGMYWVEATEHAGNVTELECTALVGSGRTVLGLAVRQDSISVASLGMFSGESTELGAGSSANGYDSRKGTYASQVAAGTNSRMGRVGSNGDVTLTGGLLLTRTTVDGNVTPGPGHAVRASGQVTVTGARHPRESAEDLPDVELPATPLASAIVHRGATARVIPEGEHGYVGLTIQNGGRVVVQGPGSLSLDTLQIDANGELHFDTTGGAITLYVATSAILASNSRLTTSSTDPTKVTIQLASEADSVRTGLLTSSQPGTFLSRGPFHGSIYAPRARTRIGASFEVFGVVIGRRVLIDAGGVVHYDQALAEQGGGDSMPRLISWRVIDLPLAIAGKRGDPFKALGLEGQTLPGPAAAHADQTIDIRYEVAGVPHTYAGLESNFDWEPVTKVNELTRDGKRAPNAAPAVAAPAAPASEAGLLDLLGNILVSTVQLTTDLLNSSPLSESTLIRSISSGRFSSNQMREILLGNSPLTPNVLARVLDGRAGLTPGHRTDVLAAQ